MEARNRKLGDWYGRIINGEIKLPQFQRFEAWGRLQSHLIPIEELANGGYEGLTEVAKIEKVRNDFTAFLQKRAQPIHKAMHFLASGRQLSASEIYK